MLLNNGDIVSIDCGTLMNGFYGDSAYTFEVGEVDPEIQKLLKVNVNQKDLFSLFFQRFTSFQLFLFTILFFQECRQTNLYSH